MIGVISTGRDQCFSHTILSIAGKTVMLIVVASFAAAECFAEGHAISMGHHVVKNWVDCAGKKEMMNSFLLLCIV